MKKIKAAPISLLIIAIIIISSSLTFAQPKREMKPPLPPSDEQITKMVSDMAQKLSLTESQKEEILTLYKVHFQKVREMMKSEKEDHQRNREEHEKFRMEFQDQVKSQLNDDQIKKYDAFVKQLEARRNNNSHGENRPQRRG